MPVKSLPDAEKAAESAIADSAAETVNIVAEKTASVSEAAIAAADKAVPEVESAKPQKATRKSSSPRKSASRTPKKQIADSLPKIPTQESNKMAEATTEKMQNMMSEFSTKAKDAFEKSTSMFGEANEFTKGNIEAVVESGKIYTKGAQELGQSMVEEARKSFEESTKAMKDMAAVKSPTEFFQLQSELARKSFDNMVAQTSKQSENMIKLMGDSFQPISNRMSLAIEKVKATAA